MITSGGWVHKDLGANHHMWTEATLEDNGRCHGTTRTASFTWFGGYTGGMRVFVLDANMTLLDMGPEVTYGVNGTAFGNSDRTDNWSFQLNPGKHAGAVLLKPAQYWAPTWRLWEPVVEVGKVVLPWVISAV